MPRRCGFTATYHAGCRCDLCRAAKAKTMREYQARRGGNLNRKPHHKQSVKVWNEGRKATYQARRAAKAGVDSEKFRASEVYDRDGWVCGICEQPVDREVRYPDPMSPSLDHIVPLSLHGAHTRSNTRLAHLACNVKRGNRAA